MAKPRILIVDDNPSFLVTLAALLEEEFDVTTVDCAEKAFEALGAGDFLVVCSDYQLPDGNGLEVLRRVLDRPAYTAGLLMTIDRTVSDGFEWPEGRTVAVVFKPFEASQLIENIQQLVQLALVRRGGQKPTR